RQLLEIARAEGVRHLVGISFGGIVALQMAIDAPDFFATLVLNSAGLGGGPQDPHAGARNVELTALYQERGPGPWMTTLWMQAPPDIFTGAREHPAVWEALRAAIDGHSWAEIANPRVMQGLV